MSTFENPLVTSLLKSGEYTVSHIYYARGYVSRKGYGYLEDYEEEN